LTIPAGAASATVTLTPIDDKLVEGNETVILTVTAAAAYAVGSPNNASVTIADNDQAALPTVTVSPKDGNASESGPDTGIFFISRTGDTTASLTVHYSLGGTAANGTDYASLSGTLTIPAGDTWAEVTLTPIDDKLVEGNETAILTLSADVSYVVGSPASATITIADNDVFPTVTVVASEANTSEGGSRPGTFTITRDGATTEALAVNYSLGGTAANGRDYQSLAGSVTIPAGAASANIVVRPINDSAVEVPELVTLTLTPNTAYTVGPLATAVITVQDDDLPLLGIGALRP
jgi:hypothetical protein